MSRARPASYAIAFGVAVAVVAAVLMPIRTHRSANFVDGPAISVVGKVYDKSMCRNHQDLKYEYYFNGLRFEGHQNARPECGRPTGSPLRIWISATDPQVSSLRSPPEQSRADPLNTELVPLIVGLFAAFSLYRALTIRREPDK